MYIQTYQWYNGLHTCLKFGRSCVLVPVWSNQRLLNWYVMLLL